MRLSLSLALGIGVGVLGLAATAQVPAAQAATAPVPAAGAATVSAVAGEPTYTCQTDTPGNTGFPILIHGIGCQASNGAPTTGVSGPVKLVINQPRYHPRVAGLDLPSGPGARLRRRHGDHGRGLPLLAPSQARRRRPGPRPGRHGVGSLPFAPGLPSRGIAANRPATSV